MIVALAAVAWTVRLSGAPPAAEERGERGRRLEIAITVDDLPVAPPGRHTTEQQEAITEALLRVLAAHGAPAVGFVNESKLEVEGAVEARRRRLLERWLEAGHELGNHGYAHLDLHRVDAAEWEADVLRGERVTRELVETRGGRLRWFRHPFLHTGTTVEVQRRTASFLAEHGYRVAPVTIDNSEWIYANAYADAWNRGDGALMDRLGRDYVRYMLEVVSFYEAQAEVILGGLLPQTLLIHAYALNAEWLGELMDALAARGYRWVPLEAALEHPAYRRPIDGYTGGGGISWLQRWAITEGRDRAIFGGEPAVPEWVSRAAEAGVGGGGEPPAPEPLLVDRVEVRPLRSRVNGVDYELRVSLPHGYAASERRYPVVYLLDADYSFLIARGITDHLAERDHLRQVILVGVGYRGQEPGRTPSYRRHRTRDYTPTFVAEGGYGAEFQSLSGGGGAFQRALSEEILPFVDRHYRTLPDDRTLVGHSYGGLFALWTLLARGELFDRYVAVSPSLWYDQRLILRLEETYGATHDELEARLYMCAGSREDPRMAGDLTALAAQLEAHRYESLSFRSRVMEGETHNSIFPGCLSNGLRYVLEGR